MRAAQPPRALAHRCRPCSRCRRAAALSSQVDDLQGELGGAKKRIRKLEKERDVAISSLRSELSREVEEATKFLLQHHESVLCRQNPIHWVESLGSVGHRFHR